MKNQMTGSVDMTRILTAGVVIGLVGVAQASAPSTGLTVAAGAGGSSVRIGNLMPGTYAGRGSWVNEQGQKGNYEAQTVIEGSRVTTRSILPDGQTKSFQMEFVSSTHGFYNVKISGHDVGHAYCVDQGPVCRYEMPGMEESIVSYEGKLYRYGSKVVDGQKLRWQEAYEMKRQSR